MGGSCSAKIAADNHSSTEIFSNKIDKNSDGYPGLGLGSVCEESINRPKVESSELIFLHNDNNCSYLNDFTSIKHLIRLNDWRNTPNASDGLLPLHAALLNADENTVRRLIEEGAHVGFRLPGDSVLADRMKTEIVRLNLNSVIAINVQSNAPISGANSPQLYDIHAAAKVGDEQGLLELLVQKSDPWLRDDFDNLALYYCSLRGHLRCAAWLLLAMGGLSIIPPNELDRCKINALTSDMKSLFKGNKKAIGTDI
jgi:ankyrin repeat protein